LAVVRMDAGASRPDKLMVDHQDANAGSRRHRNTRQSVARSFAFR